MKSAIAVLVALCAAALLIVDFRHWRIGDPRRASQRTVGVAILVLLASTMVALARPSPYPPVTQFVGDRYVGTAQMGADVVKAVKARRHLKVRYLYPTRKRPPVARQRWRHVPMPAARPVTSEAYRVEAPLTVLDGARREVAQIIGGRPAGCPHAFCGCGASLHLFGRIIPALNLAANWLRFPRAAPAPKMAAARRGHVFVLERHIAGNVWLVHDSNSGGGRTRLHARSIAGYVIVDPRGSG